MHSLKQRCPTHSPHLSNVRLKVTNGFISKSFKNVMFLDKIDISKLIYTCSDTKKTLVWENRAPDMKTV